MASKKAQLIQRVERRGEGAAIEFQREPVPTGDGTAARISINLATAPVPDRRYPAEVAGVVKSDHMVRLLFGQTKAIGRGLNTLLVIHVSFIGVKHFIASMKPGVVQSARDYLNRHSISTPSLLDVSKESDQPTSAVNLEGNIIGFAFHGREACLDFYHASSFVWHNLARGGKFYAEPVVRVTLPTALAMAVFNSLEDQESTYPADELEGTT